MFHEGQSPHSTSLRIAASVLAIGALAGCGIGGSESKAATTAVAAPTPTPSEKVVATLKPGDKGPLVAELQRELESIGCDVKALDPATSPFGPMTEKAVKTFQENKFLLPTGIANARLQAQIKNSNDTGCGANSSSSAPSPTAEVGKISATTEACISSMPLQQRLGQMIMIGVYSGKILNYQAVIKKYQIGGVIVMGDGTSADRANILQLKAINKIRTLTATDEEGGQVQRFKRLGVLPAAANVVKTMSTAEAESMIASHGRKLADEGIDMVFGPLMDVAPKNGVSPLGNRVFSNNPQIVKNYANAYAKGWKTSGINPVFKHFPGMGAASGNTDFTVAKTANIAQLRKRDMLPYANLSATSVVMMGNQIVPGGSNGLPSSISKAMVNELRLGLGFNGLIITDSLNAEALRLPATEADRKILDSEKSISTTVHTTKLPIEKAISRALVAGNDIALIVDPPVGSNWETVLSNAMAQLKSDHQTGVLSDGQLNQSVGRILAAKHEDPCTVR